MAQKDDPTPAPVVSENFLPELSAEDVHKNIIRCHTLKNRVHRKLIGWLHVLIARDHVRKLGAPGRSGDADAAGSLSFGSTIIRPRGVPSISVPC